MTNTSHPLIGVATLKTLEQDPNLILIDARSGPNAHQEYLEEHLKNARFVDLETHLSDIGSLPAQGGRHPLPNPQAFAHILQSLGIVPHSHVVVYDLMGGANAAARFWWMLCALGHKNVQVLDGGFQQAKKMGYPTASGTEEVTPGEEYPITDWQLPQTNMATIRNISQDPDYLVVDVRASGRYQGEFEPIDPVAGHIPGAINIPLSENLDGNGCFKSPEALRALYSQAFGDRPSSHIHFHCGSGVTACHSLLAIAQAGLPLPNLYVGSWSEWCNNDNTIATGTA